MSLTVGGVKYGLGMTATAASAPLPKSPALIVSTMVTPDESFPEPVSYANGVRTVSYTHLTLPTKRIV